MFKNKKIMVLLGSVLFVLVLAIFLWPHFSSGYMGQTVEVVMVADKISEGTLITEGMIKVGQYPSAYLTDSERMVKDEVVGHYAAAELFTGDVITKEKVVAVNEAIFYEPESLLAVTMPSLSASVAAKLQSQDYVNVYGYPKDNINAGIVWRPAILQGIEVAYVVSSDAQDAGEGIAPASVVFKITSPEQAQELVKLEYTAQIHLERISNNVHKSGE